MTTISKVRYSRRSILKSGGAAVAAAALPAPMVWGQETKNITLRQFGTGVSNLNDVALKVKEDLGFTLEMTALDTDSVTQRAATQPNSFDIADIEYFICKKVWAAGNLQAMDTSKIAQYDNIAGTFRSGLLTPESTIAQGTAPHTVGFTTGVNGTKFVQEESGWMTLIPTIYNADTLGIRPDLIGRPINNWSELLNPEFKGKASILDISSIGIMDMALVVESMGEYTYPDKGNMTREEIDLTLGIFTEAKKNGQFRAFWKSFDESVNLMASGEVVIQSMWSPALRLCGRRVFRAFISHLKKVTGHGEAGLACLQLSLELSWMQPMNTSTGISPAGLAATDASGLLFSCSKTSKIYVRRRVGLLVRRQSF